MLNASTASAALGAAIETGLLWMLSDQPMDDMSIAQALNIPARRCRYWLQLLEEMGIVKHSSQGYAPSTLARIAEREIAAEHSLSGRIVYQPVEFDSGDFPDGFDMILLCDVGIFGEPLFRKLRASLNAGGKLIIVWRFPSAEGTAPGSRIDLTFLDSLEDPGFALPTIAQTQEQLLHAGFDPLAEEYAFPDGRIAIQAQAT